MNSFRWLSAVSFFIACAISCGASAQKKERAFIPGELIVGFKTEADRETAFGLLQAKEGLQLLNGERAEKIDVQRLGASEVTLRVTMPPGIKALAEADSTLERKVLDDLAAKLLEEDKTIQYAHPNWITTIDPMERNPATSPGVEKTIKEFAAGEPNDPFFTSGRHWHYQATPQGMNAVNAWGVTRGEQAVVVAVIDTGIVGKHPDISKTNLLPGFSFTKSGRKAGALDDADCNGFHGSHVSGTVGVVGTNNKIGMAGVGWQVMVLPIRVFNGCEGATTVDVSDAIRWAAGLPVKGIPGNNHPAQVINLSLGMSVPCSLQDNGYMYNAIEAALAAGATIVAAAGNESQNVAGVSPGGCPGVISVAAHDASGRLTWYSNFGEVTIMAPGGDIQQKDASGTSLGVWSLVRPTKKDPLGIVAYQGTSMAAPHVTGAIALAMSANSDLRGHPSAVMAAIKASAARLAPGTCPMPCGAGQLDAGALVKLKEIPTADDTRVPDREISERKPDGIDEPVVAAARLDGLWMATAGSASFEIEGGEWRHPKLGVARIAAETAGHMEVIYENHQQRCAYRIEGVAGASAIMLMPTDPTQSPDACPTGQFNRAAPMP